jgi:hypothetical protein
VFRLGVRPTGNVQVGALFFNANKLKKTLFKLLALTVIVTGIAMCGGMVGSHAFKFQSIPFVINVSTVTIL